MGKTTKTCPYVKRDKTICGKPCVGDVCGTHRKSAAKVVKVESEVKKPKASAPIDIKNVKKPEPAKKSQPKPASKTTHKEVAAAMDKACADMEALSEFQKGKLRKKNAKYMSLISKK